MLREAFWEDFNFNLYYITCRVSVTEYKDDMPKAKKHKSSFTEVLPELSPNIRIAYHLFVEIRC